jgi:DMSO/TMAO reductase YedYZ molybdopterin-dependent catalytic subunit
MRQRTRRSFLTGAVAAAAGFGAWEWVRTCSLEDGIPWPLRRVLEWNEHVARAYFKESRLAPEFSSDRVGEMKVNGRVGIRSPLDASAWRLRVEGSGTPATFELKDIQALPRVEMITEFKCVEGWSEIMSWAGARLADFIAQCPQANRTGQPGKVASRSDLFEYVGMSTPDRDYYVGLDLASALQPQTLLAYEMNGAPLTAGHGAPLRLVIPVKYGIKNIKRIGTIHFTDQRPSDYWHERGYDWYAGH